MGGLQVGPRGEGGLMQGLGGPQAGAGSRQAPRVKWDPKRGLRGPRVEGGSPGRSGEQTGPGVKGVPKRGLWGRWGAGVVGRPQVGPGGEGGP